MEEFESRYLAVLVNPEQIGAARVLKPIHERQGSGQHPAVRSCRTPATRRAWRRANAKHRRLFVAVLSKQSAAFKRADEYSIKHRAESPLESQVNAPAVITAVGACTGRAARIVGAPLIYIAPLAAALFVCSPS